MRDQLLAVADAEYGNSRAQNRRLDSRAGVVVNAAGAARDDNASRGPQRFKGCFAGKYFRRYAEIAYLAGDKVAVLAAGVQYCDLCVRSYFCILSTTIL